MIKIEAKKLSAALKVVSPAISKNKVIPITECIKISVKNNLLTVVGTSVDLFIVHSIEHQGLDYEVIVSFPKLEKISALGYKEISITQNKNSVLVKGDSTPYDIGEPINANAFPIIPTLEEEEGIEVPGDFYWAMNQALKTVCKQDFSPQHHVLVHAKKNSIEVVSADFYYMFHQKFITSATLEKKVLVDVNFIKSTSAFSDSKIYISEKRICAKNKNTEVYSSIHEGQFIPYEVLLGRYKSPNCIINIDDIKFALSEIEAVKTQFTEYAKFNFSGNSIKICYSDNAVRVSASPEILVKNTSDLKEIIFNVGQMSTVLSQLPPEAKALNFSFLGETTSAYITPDTDDDIKLLIQPVKLEVK